MPLPLPILDDMFALEAEPPVGAGTVKVLVAGSTNAAGHFDTSSGIVEGRQSWHAIRQAVADELDLDPADVTIIDGTTAGSVVEETARGELAGTNFWWSIADDLPGPLLVDLIANVEEADAIVWAEGEDYARAILDPPGHAGETDPSAARWRTATTEVLAALAAEYDCPVILQGLGRIYTDGEEVAGRERQDMLIGQGLILLETGYFSAVDMDARPATDYAADGTHYRPNVYHEGALEIGRLVAQIVQGDLAAPAEDVAAGVLRVPTDLAAEREGGSTSPDNIILSWQDEPGDADPDDPAFTIETTSLDESTGTIRYEIELIDEGETVYQWETADKEVTLTEEMQAEIFGGLTEEVTFRARIVTDDVPGPWVAAFVDLGVAPTLTVEPPVINSVFWTAVGSIGGDITVEFEAGGGSGEVAETYKVRFWVDGVQRKGYNVTEDGSPSYEQVWPLASQRTKLGGAPALSVEVRVAGVAAGAAQSPWVSFSATYGEFPDA
jgi:hypothetical protein